MSYSKQRLLGLLGLVAIFCSLAAAQDNGTVIRLSEDEMKEIFRFRHQRGVNAGGVFVLERWMNGNFFDHNGIPGHVGSSSQAFTDGINNAARAKELLDDRALNFVTECDYQQMANIGLNTVRLPIGYWSLGDKFPDTPMLEPFNKWTSVYNNTLEQIHLHYQRAAKYGLGLLLDIHGAPGSQNGADHSGVNADTQLYNQQIYMDTLVNVVRRLTEIFKVYPNMVGIEIMNEPREHNNLQTIYKNAYAAVRSVDPTMPVYICDTVWSSNLEKWSGFIQENNWELGFLDVHRYYAFNGGGTTASRYPDIITNNDKPYLASIHNRAGVVIGEWSNALNGGSWNGYNQQQQNDLKRRIGAAQLDSYNQLGGYHFWSWKTDKTWQDWDFQQLVADNIYPSDLNCWPISSCATARREYLKNYALEKLPTERQDGLAQHRAYWERTNPTGVYDWNIYLDGFDAGFNTAIRFHYAMSSRVGMKRELAAWRRKLYAADREAQGLSNTSAWQFRDAFLEGLTHLESLYEKAPASS